METQQQISVSYRMTIDEFLTALSYHLKYSTWRPPYAKVEITLEILAVAILVYFGVFSGSAQMTFRHDTLQSIVILILAGASLFIFIFVTPLILVPAFNKWFTESYETRRFLKGTERDKLVQVTVDARSIISRVESLPEKSYKWNVIKKVVRTPKGFLFWPYIGMGPWIPSHAFTSEDEAEALAQLARQYVRKFIEVA